MAQQKRSLHQVVSTDIVSLASPSEPTPTSSNDLIKERLVTMVAGSLLLLVFVVLGITIFGHWALMLASTQVLVYVVVAAVVLLMFGGVVLVPLAIFLGRLHKQRMEEKILDTELHLQVSRLHPDEAGNYPHIWNEQEQRLIATPAGQFKPNVPEHWAPHFAYRDTSTRVTEEQGLALPPAHIEIPTFKEAWYKGLIHPEQPDALLCHQLIEDEKTHQVVASKPVRGLLEDNSTMLLTGESTSGKSTLMATLGGQYAMMDALLCVVDPHLSHEEKSVARKLAPIREAFLIDPVGDEPHEIQRVHTLLKAEADLRKYKGDSRYDMHPIVLIVDEILALMLRARIASNDDVRRVYFNFAVFLLEMSTQYAKFGISGILASQYVTKADFKVKYKGHEVDCRDGCINQTTFRLPGNQASALGRIDSRVKPFIPDLKTGFGYMALPGRGTIRMASGNLVAGDLELIAPTIRDNRKYHSHHFAMQEAPRRNWRVTPSGSLRGTSTISTQEDDDTPFAAECEDESVDADEHVLHPYGKPLGGISQRYPGATQEAPACYKKVFTPEQEIRFVMLYQEHQSIERCLREMKIGNDYRGYASDLVRRQNLKRQ